MTEEMQRAEGWRRPRSAQLSAIAGCFTLALFTLALVLSSTPNKVWIVTIGFPPIVMSFVAVVQYRRTTHTGAGAAAAAAYWVLAAVYFTHSGGVFVLGALIQTAAWFISRPRRTERVRSTK